MSKSLCSMSEHEREVTITRRILSNTKGIGYWAAVDAQARLAKRTINVSKAKAESILPISKTSQ